MRQGGSSFGISVGGAKADPASMTSGMIIVIGLLAFTLVSGLLLASNRSQGGRSSGETWRAFAQASGGTYSQNPFGRARKVTFTDGGRTITLEAWSTLDGPGDSILSYTKLLAQGKIGRAHV